MSLKDIIRNTSPIAFPGLFGGWQFTADAKALDIGNGIYWYGIFIALGLLLGLTFCSRQAPRFGLTEDNIMDSVLWGMPIGILGARLYYIIFYLDLYKNADGSLNFGKMVRIWDGGLAIYGGVIAGFLTVYVLSRVKKFSYLAVMDDLVMGVLIGQILGRWGNFMNREAFGAETDIFCRMGLTAPDGATIYVHPTFLYESLWNLGVFLFLLWFEKTGRRRFDGHCITLYFLLYGIGRFWIEGLRTDSLYLGNTGIRVSQALSLVLALSAAALLLYMKSQPFSPDHLYVNRVAAKEAGMIIEKREES